MLSIVLNFAGPWWPHPHTPNHMSLYHPLRRPCLFISLFPRAGFALWRRPDQWLAIVHGKNLISCRCLPWLFRRRTWTSAMISSEFLLFVQLCNSKCEISLPEWRKTNNFLGQNMRKNHHISIHKKTTIETFPNFPQKKLPPCRPSKSLGTLVSAHTQYPGEAQSKATGGILCHSQVFTEKGATCKMCSFAKCMFSWICCELRVCDSFVLDIDMI